MWWKYYFLEMRLLKLDQKMKITQGFTLISHEKRRVFCVGTFVRFIHCLVVSADLTFNTSKGLAWWKLLCIKATSCSGCCEKEILAL